MKRCTRVDVSSPMKLLLSVMLGSFYLVASGVAYAETCEAARTTCLEESQAGEINCSWEAWLALEDCLNDPEAEPELCQEGYEYTWGFCQHTRQQNDRLCYFRYDECLENRQQRRPPAQYS